MVSKRAMFKTWNVIPVCRLVDRHSYFMGSDNPQYITPELRTHHQSTIKIYHLMIFMSPCQFPDLMINPARGVRSHWSWLSGDGKQHDPNEGVGDVECLGDTLHGAWTLCVSWFQTIQRFQDVPRSYALFNVFDLSLMWDCMRKLSSEHILDIFDIQFISMFPMKNGPLGVNPRLPSLWELR